MTFEEYKILKDSTPIQRGFSRDFYQECYLRDKAPEYTIGGPKFISFDFTLDVRDKTLAELYQYDERKIPFDFYGQSYHKFIYDFIKKYNQETIFSQDDIFLEQKSLVYQSMQSELGNMTCSVNNMTMKQSYNDFMVMHNLKKRKTDIFFEKDCSENRIKQVINYYKKRCCDFDEIEQGVFDGIFRCHKGKYVDTINTYELKNFIMSIIQEDFVMPDLSGGERGVFSLNYGVGKTKSLNHTIYINKNRQIMNRLHGAEYYKNVKNDENGLYDFLHKERVYINIVKKINPNHY